MSKLKIIAGVYALSAIFIAQGMENKEKEVIQETKILYGQKIAKELEVIKRAKNVNELTFTRKNGEVLPLIFKYCTKEYYAPLLKYMLENKANPNSTDQYKRYLPLVHAVCYKAYKNAEFLLEYKANPNQEARDPRTHFACRWVPINMSIEQEDTVMLHLLLAHGADANYDGKVDELPIVWTVKKYCEDRQQFDEEVQRCIAMGEYFYPGDHAELQEKLKECKALLEECTPEKIMEKTKEESYVVFKLLLLYGADPLKKDCHGKSALELIRERGTRPDLEKLLMANAQNPK